MKHLQSERVELPGGNGTLLFERSAKGRLARLSGGGRVYLEDRDGTRLFDGGFAEVTELVRPRAVLRAVRAAGQSWLEDYRWDEHGRPAFIDGAVVRRDERGRIVACEHPEARWTYAYEAEDLVRVDGPFGVRRIRRGALGAPVACEEPAGARPVRYDDDGVRLDVPRLAPRWHRDELGRLWTVQDGAGRIVRTFLWDGFACLGRVDGPLGDPLAAVFSLDASNTPVRVIERGRVVRVPRDAFGEGLLACDGVPGLHGGVNEGGFVHFRSRALDPRTGAFDRADPWHGRSGDPRRARGFDGPLPVERSAAGPFAACRYDPVARVDPTGEMPFLIGLSDVTWALPNNLAFFFLFDWWFNFVFSLFRRIGNSKALDEFFSSEDLKAKHSEITGTRRDGLLSPAGQVWTSGHRVWAKAKEFSELAVAHAFVPNEQDPDRITGPTLYGTLLLVEPQKTLAGKALSRDAAEQSQPFLLRGSGRTGANVPTLPWGWTRSGGRARPVYPGAAAPRFPAGGLHFDGGPGTAEFFEGRGAPQTIGNKTMELWTEESSGPPLVGDRFKVAGDERTYVVTGVAPSALPPAPYPFTSPGYRWGNQIAFEPPAAQPWKQYAKIEFETRFALPAPQDATLTELETDGTPVPGKVARQAVLEVPAKPLGEAPGRQFALIAATNLITLVEVAEAVEVGDKTRLRLKGDALKGLAAGRFKVLGLGAAIPGAPGLTSRVEPRLLNAPAPAGSYAAGDVVKLKWGATDELVVRLVDLSARLQLDEPLPDSLRPEATLDLYEPVPAAPEKSAKLTAQNRRLNFQLAAGAVARPAAGDVLLLTLGPKSMAVRVEKQEGADEIGVDRPLTPLGGVANDEVKWKPLAKTREIGTRARGDSGQDHVTFVPSQSANTPAAGVVVIHSGGKHIPRRILSQVFDALVLDRELPAGAGPNFTTERHPKRESKAAGDARRIELAWVFSPAPGKSIGPDARAAVLYGVPSAAPLALVPGTTLNVTFAGTQAKQTTPLNRLSTPIVSQLIQASDAAGTKKASGVVQRLRLDLTLDRQLPAAAAAGRELDLVLLQPGGPEYEATALDKLVARVAPQVTVGAVQRDTEMPRFQPGELVLAGARGSGAPYRVAEVDGTTLKLELAAGDLPGAAFPAPITVARLAPKSPENGTSRAGRRGRVGASPEKITFDVWSPDQLAVNDRVAVVDGDQVYPAIILSLDELRIDLALDEAVPAGAGQIDVPQTGPVEYATILKREGGALVLEENLAAAFGGDALLVAFKPSPRTLAGTLTPGTVKVPNHLENSFDLTRHEALAEHELHHTRQSAELGPLLLAFIPTWAIELVVDLHEGEERVKFEKGWDVYFHISELLSLGGIMNLTVGSTYAGALWLVALLVHGLNTLIKDKTGDDSSVLDYLDPFALKYFPATVPDPASPRVVEIGPREGETLELAVNDRVQVQDPDDRTAKLAFFDHRRTVVKKISATRYELDEESLPVKGPERRLQIAKATGQDDPIHRVDNAVMRGLGLGWMAALFDPYGELHLRVAPERGSAADVLLRVGRYAFGSKSWSFIPPFFGYAFLDNLRRQWGFLGSKPYLARMEKGASYASGDTYYPLGLLRATGQAATLLGQKQKQLCAGDVAQFWHLPDGGSRAHYSLVVPGRQDAPGVHFQSIPCVMPEADPNTCSLILFPVPVAKVNDVVTALLQVDPALNAASALALVTSAPVTVLRNVSKKKVDEARAKLESAGATAVWGEPNQGLRTPAPAAAATTGPGLAVADTFTRKPAADPAAPEPGGFFLPTPRAWIPTSAALERTAGIYVAFTKASGPARHRLTLVDDAAPGSSSGREAFEAGRSDLIHDLEVLDVEVRLGGTKVAEGGELALLPFQKAALEVSPGGERRYDLFLIQPKLGIIRRLDTEPGLTTLQTAATSAEPAEVGRIYQHDPKAANGFADTALNGFGLHLPGDLFVPVRRFKVKVVTVLQVRAEADPDAAPVAVPFKAGQRAVLLVPVRVLPSAPGKLNPTLAVTYAPGAPAGARVPRLNFDITAVDESALPRLKTLFKFGGSIVAIPFPADDPPEEETEMKVTIQVGTAAAPATLTADMKLAPHFQIKREDGGADYKVNKGAELKLVCTNASKRVRVTSPADAGVSFEVAAEKLTMKVAADATPRAYSLVVEDTANPGQQARRMISIEG